MDDKLPTDEILTIARASDANRQCRLVDEAAVSLQHIDIQPFTVDPKVRFLLPAKAARAYAVVPIRTANERPVIAVSEPVDRSAIEYLLRQVPNCIVVSAMREDVERTISELYW